MRRSLKEELEFGKAGEIPLEDGALQFSFLYFEESKYYVGKTGKFYRQRCVLVSGV